MPAFLIFGHRGSPRRFRENSVDSFAEALRVGADGFETDLRLLADGTAVLFHDDEVGLRPVESLSSGDLPTAERVGELARFAGQGTMVLEVKRGKWEDRLLVEISGWPDIVVASFDHSLIASLARRLVSFPLGLTIAGVIAGLPDYARRVGASWCFPDHHYVDGDMVAALHGAGLRVIPWTPNRPTDWGRLRDMGCDGIITDFPAEAVTWRGESG